jgi:hypothetical protein
MFQWWDIFFCGVGLVVVVFCIKPSPPSCWCFMFPLPLCALCLTYPFLSFFFARQSAISCTVKDNPGHGRFEVDEINGEGGEGACFV